MKRFALLKSLIHSFWRPHLETCTTQMECPYCKVIMKRRKQHYIPWGDIIGEFGKCCTTFPYKNISKHINGHKFVVKEVARTNETSRFKEKWQSTEGRHGPQWVKQVKCKRNGQTCRSPISFSTELEAGERDLTKGSHYN